MHRYDLSSSSVAWPMHLFRRFSFCFALRSFAVDICNQNGDFVNIMNEAMNSMCASILFHFNVIAPTSANCAVVYAFFGSDSNRPGLSITVGAPGDRQGVGGGSPLR